MKESRRERFERLATSRTKAVLDKIRLLGNLSNRHAYDYSEKDIEKIFSTIEDQLKIVKSKFKTPKKGKEFKL